MKQPEPEIRRTRTWAITWPRPRQMGWPNITRRRPSTQEIVGIAPKLVRITVRQMSDGEIRVDSMEVRGTWTRSGRACSWQRLSQALVAGTYHWAPAPDWVHDLADASVQLVEKELADG